MSLRHLTVHFVTTRIKLAKTVVKLATESSTVPSSATLQQILSVASVEMQAIWPEIVLTGPYLLAIVQIEKC